MQKATVGQTNDALMSQWHQPEHSFMIKTQQARIDRNFLNTKYIANITLSGETPKLSLLNWKWRVLLDSFCLLINTVLEGLL